MSKLIYDGIYLYLCAAHSNADDRITAIPAAVGELILARQQPQNHSVIKFKTRT